MHIMYIFLAHQLRLTLIVSAKEIVEVHCFFQNLSIIINVMCYSCKCHDELRDVYATEFSYSVANDEIEIGKGANRIGTILE